MQTKRPSQPGRHPIIIIYLDTPQHTKTTIQQQQPKKNDAAQRSFTTSLSTSILCYMLFAQSIVPFMPRITTSINQASCTGTRWVNSRPHVDDTGAVFPQLYAQCGADPRWWWLCARRRVRPGQCARMRRRFNSGVKPGTQRAHGQRTSGLAVANSNTEPDMSYI